MLSSFRSTFYVIIVFVTVVGCGEKSKDPTAGDCEIAGDSYAITGGRVLGSGNALSSTTVLLGSSKGGCTGTLIAQNVVLTAAHCLIKGEPPKIFFTNNVLCSRSVKNKNVQTVTEMFVHESYQSAKDSADEMANDIAILKFDGELPSGYKVRSLPSKEYKMPASASFVLSGYGLTTETDEEHKRVLHFVKIASSSLTIRSWPEPNKIISIEIPDIGTCPGDSGGPLYSDSGTGDLTLLGVASRGNCKGWSIYTSVQAHLDWIVQKMAKFDH